MTPFLTVERTKAQMRSAQHRTQLFKEETTPSQLTGSIVELLKKGAFTALSSMRFSRIATYYNLLFDPIIADPETGSPTSVSAGTTTCFLNQRRVLMNKRGGHQNDESIKNIGRSAAEYEEEQHLIQEEARHVDISDNEAQKQIILDHYCHKAMHSELDFLRDYTDSSIVHVCVDNVASTFHGKEGGRRAFDHVPGSSHHGNHHINKNLQVQHILVQNNHAKVEWQEDVQKEPDRIESDPTTAKKMVLVGTDWFTFDAQNHIQTQTTVALSQPEE